jgi:hypothetical protein
MKGTPSFIIPPFKFDRRREPRLRADTFAAADGGL